MASRQQRAQKRARQHNLTVYRQGTKATQAILRGIRDARLVLVEELSRSSSLLEQARIQSILGELEQELVRWQALSNSRMSPALSSAAQGGTSIVRDALEIRGGLRIAPLQATTQEFLTIASQHSADLIRDISDDTLQKVNRILRRGALAQTPPTELIRQVSPQVGRGVFAQAGTRAEFVVRTEMSRVLNLSTQERMQSLKDRNVLEKKQWVSVFDARTRPEHVTANGQVKGVEQAYSVGGESLMYPGDQSGDPAMTVNCRCVSVPYIGVG